jgi:hypothetical protein
MKISRTNSSQKKTVIIVAVVIALAALLATALELMHVTDFIKDSKNTTSGPTRAEERVQNEVNQNSKEDFIKSPEPTTSPVPEPVSSDVELSAKQESNGDVTVLTKLQNISSGSCTITVTNGTANYTDSADIIYQPSFSSCAGFSIEKKELGAGDWMITLSVNNNPTLSKTITTEVN